MMGSILHGHGAEHRDHMRLSLDKFNMLTENHLTVLATAQKSLHQVSAPFKEKGDIRPVHCRIAIECLDETREHVRGLCGLLHGSASLPIVITALRYQLLLILYRIEEQISELVDFIDDYRLICIKPSQHTLQQRKDIYGSFETLLEYLTDISQEAKLVDDEAKFQERKIMAKLEEQPSTDKTNSDAHEGLYIVKQYEDDNDAS